MSNFQELQAQKKEWTLASDETLFEKLKFLEDNVVASTHLVHNSINELNKAYQAADITLNNSINAYNQLSFNKFVENVVEGQDSDLTFGGSMTNEGHRLAEAGMDQTTVMSEMRSEDDKLTEALSIALNEVNLAKEDKKDAKAAQDEDGMVDGVVLEGSTMPVQIDSSKFKNANIQKRNYLGTSKVIKLPYIIGREEYKKHPFAGLVYRGEDELEQLDLYEEEMQQLLNDKKFEEE